jgi:hypothetical protein
MFVAEFQNASGACSLKPAASALKRRSLGDRLALDKAAKRDRRRRGATEGAAVQANRVLTRLRTFLGWAVANAAERPARGRGQRHAVGGDQSSAPVAAQNARSSGSVSSRSAGVSHHRNSAPTATASRRRA